MHKALNVAFALCTAAVLSGELLVHYSFNEKSGNSANDSSGSGITAVVSSAWVTGAFGGALKLSGESASIASLQLPADKQFGTGSITVSCWIYPDTFAIDAKDKRRRIMNLVDAWPAQYMVLEVKDNGQLTYSMGSKMADGKYSGGGVTSKNMLKAGAWTHIAVVLDRDAKKIRAYINGSMENESTLSDTFEGDFKAGKPVTIGSGWQGFIGCIDEVKLHRNAVDGALLKTTYESEKANYTGVIVAAAAPVAAAAASSPIPAERAGPPLMFYVSPNGNDEWSGTFPEVNAAKTDGPFKTLGKVSGILKAGDVCLLREGSYRDTLDIRRSGKPGSPIVISNYRNEKAVISGADVLGGWTREGSVYVAPAELTLADQNQVFAGGEVMVEARWPNTTNAFLYTTRAEMASGSISNRIVDPDLPGDDDAWKGAQIWCSGGAAWYCWNAAVTGYDAAKKTLSFDAIKGHNDWYWPRKGNEYVLMGVRSALDADNEWFYDNKEKRLYLQTPGGADPETLGVEVKRRLQCVAMTGVSNIRIEGIAVRAGGVLIDAKSSDIVLKRISVKYPGHSFVNDVSGTGSIVMRGSNCALVDSELSHSSGSLVAVYGMDNKVINCFIHDGNYAGKWSGAVTLSGRRAVFAYNTVRDAGRDIISCSGLTESIVEHNDLSRAGWLTHDLGMTYGHTTDFQNTVFRNNLVHDNMSKKTAMGIYFDHVTMNVIVHNNAVWNVGLDPLRINNPSYNCLVFNNSTFKAGDVGTFDHSKRNDLYGCRYYNNIVPKSIKLPKHVFIESNISIMDKDVNYRDAENGQLDLSPGSPAIGAAFRDAGMGNDAGAFETGKPVWRAGHDFSKPAPRLAYEPPDVPYMNLVKNSCFEYDLERWTKTGEGSAKKIAGNGWGNGYGKGAPEPTGTCRGELELTGRSGVEQTVTGLYPDTEYTLFGWVKTAPGETAAVSVSGHGGDTVTTVMKATNWARVFVEFKTGSSADSAIVSIKKTSSGNGFVCADTFGLPKKPKGSSWERPPLDMSTGAVGKAASMPPAYTIARVSRKPEIDGTASAGEWPERIMKIEQSASRELLKSEPGTARLCHDGETLYVTVTVPVKKAADIKQGSSWGNADGAEICFIDAKGAAPTMSYVVHGFAGGGSESLATGGVSAEMAKRVGGSIRYAARIDGSSWTGEWAIPLTSADITGNSGQKLAFNICVHRSDSGEWMLWVGSLGAAYQLENGGTVIFE